MNLKDTKAQLKVIFDAVGLKPQDVYIEEIPDFLGVGLKESLPRSVWRELHENISSNLQGEYIQGKGWKIPIEATITLPKNQTTIVIEKEQKKSEVKKLDESKVKEQEVSNMMLIDEVKFLEDFYPRDKWDNETVNSYRLNIDVLPPIIIQREEKILVDGYHRLLAHRLEGLKEIKVDFVDIPKKKILWEATKCNAKHGLQLSMTEKKRMARRFFQQDISQKDIAEVLAVSVRSLSNWLKDLVQDAREEQRKKIIDLYLKCLTYREIIEQLKTNNTEISKTLQKLKDAFLEQPIIPDSLQVFDVWNFSGLDTRYGLKGTKGQIPAQIVENVLHYYTEPFDVVIDPMSGGGTTLDVCKAYYRRWRAYDINPLRDDIKKHDITQGFPNECNNCDFIFLDPPYYNKVIQLFENLDSFRAFIKKLSKDCFKTVKKGGYVAFLCSNYFEYEAPEKSFYTGEALRMFKDAKFEAVMHIQCPLSTQQYRAYDVERVKKEKQFLIRSRDLYVFRKPK